MPQNNQNPAHTSVNKQKLHSPRRSKGLQIVSNTKPNVSDQSINSPSLDPTDPIHPLQKPKTKPNLQTHESQKIDRNYSFIIDYQNARYHGKVASPIANNAKLLKDGPGILIDDDVNFIYSNWKNNLPNGRTVLIDRLGNYFYSKLTVNSGNPAGSAFVRIGSILLLANFSQKTGAWNMTVPDKENMIIAIDEKALCLLVLKGKVQQISGQFKCSKSSPLSVVEFAHFATELAQKTNKKQANDFKSGTSHRSKTSQCIDKPKIEDILLTYAQKYGFKVQNCQASISEYFESIAQNIKKECLSSKQFSYEVTRNLVNQVFSHHKNQVKPNKQNYESYEKQKNKIYDNKFLIFAQCSSISSKIKEQSFYFGFLNGLGIRFKNQHTDHDKSHRHHKIKTFKAKSIGIHNQDVKIQEIGARFYDNNCIEEGNFKAKSTFTYENPVFRPTNKLISIYNKYHKQQTSFLNEYFDKNQIPIFKLLSGFQSFVSEHILYIMNQCLIETTKFNEKNELIQKVLLKNYQKQHPIPNLFRQSKIKGPAYEVHVERKNKNHDSDIDQSSEALNALKDKKSQLKEKIKKVKYEIQYLPSESTNVVITNDDKFMSKIKKHLSTHQNDKTCSQSKVQKNQRKSLSERSQSKSATVSRSKSRRTYIQKDKPKVASPIKNRLSSPVKTVGIDDSLDLMENSQKKRLDLSVSKTEPKTEAEILLNRINNSIEFRQKFNYGIEFNIEHNKISRKSVKQQSTSKNQYNGRGRFFTDNELDSAVDHHLSSSSQVSVKSITPGKKNKKKDQSRHMIYSNARRNNQNEQEKYEIQKETEETIRAQILGLSLKEYRKRTQVQNEQHAFMEENFLKIIEQEESLLRSSIRRIQYESPQFPDPNQTFGVYGNDSVKLSPSIIHTTSGRQNQSKTMSFLQSVPKAQAQGIKNSIQEQALYCPKPKQQTLVEKRLRILQDYKEMNGRYFQREESRYVPLYNNNLWSENTESPSFREYSPSDFKKQKYFDNLPVYKEKASKKMMSPLKSMAENRENSEIVPYGKSSYVGLETSKKARMPVKQKEIHEQIERSYQKSRGKDLNEQPLSALATAKSMTRKYQYYFD